MDVRLPDGTLIKGVPEGTTQTQLREKLQRNGYDVSKLTMKQPRANVAAEEPGILDKLTKKFYEAAGGFVGTEGMQAPIAGMGGVAIPFDKTSEAYRAGEIARTGAKIGSDIGLGMAAGAGTGLALQALGRAPQVVQAAPQIAKGLDVLGKAVMTGGTTKTAAKTLTGGAAARLGGAALGGAVSSGVINPEEAGKGAGIATVLSLASPIVGKAGEVVSTFTAPEKQALLKAAGDKIENIITELKKGGEIVPGTQPHAGLVATPAESAGFSSFVQSLLKSKNEDVNKIIGEIVSDTEATDELARQLYARGLFKTAEDAKLALLSQTAPKAEPEAALTSLGKGLSQQQAALETAAQKEAAAVPESSQMELGGKISAVREKAIETAKKEITTPAYERAFSLAEKPFDVQPIVETSKRILKEPATKFNRDLAPLTDEVLQTFKPEEIKGKIVGLAGEQLTPTKVTNTATLREVDGLIKALNSDIASVKRSAHNDAPSTLRNLEALKTSVESTIKTGLPEEASKAYKEARQLYKTEVIEPYFKDWTVKLQRETSTRVPQLRGSDVVPTIMGSEEAATQFTKGLSKNEDARNAVKLGIEDMYRNEVLDPKTGIVNFGKHAKFMQDNKKVLSILDKNGVGISQVLNNYGKQAKGVETAMDTLAQEAKGLQYATPEAMISDFSKNYDKLQRGLKVMDQSSKQQVSRALLADALSKSPEEIQASKSLRLALQASHPKEANEIIKQAALQAEMTKLATAGENMLKPEFPSMMNDLARQKKVAELTSKFTPEQMKDFRALEKEAARAKTFESLAERGGYKGTAVVSDLLEDANLSKKPIPGFFNRIVTLARHVFDRFEGKLDKEQAVELAKAMINPKLAAQALEDAKAWQMSKQGKNVMAGKVGGVVSRGAAIIPAESENRNQLRQSR